jgi:hypothetical protein
MAWLDDELSPLSPFDFWLANRRQELAEEVIVVLKFTESPPKEEPKSQEEKELQELEKKEREEVLAKFPSASYRIEHELERSHIHGSALLKCFACKPTYIGDSTEPLDSAIYVGINRARQHQAEVHNYHEPGILTQFLRLEKSRKFYCCKICKIEFEREPHLEAHTQVEHPEHPLPPPFPGPARKLSNWSYPCLLCDKSFDNDRKRKRHIRTEHPDESQEEELWKCPICMPPNVQTFDSERKFNQHCKVKHPVGSLTDWDTQLSLKVEEQGQQGEPEKEKQLEEVEEEEEEQGQQGEPEKEKQPEEAEQRGEPEKQKHEKQQKQPEEAEQRGEPEKQKQSEELEQCIEQIVQPFDSLLIAKRFRSYWYCGLCNQLFETAVNLEVHFRTAHEVEAYYYYNPNSK